MKREITYDKSRIASTVILGIFLAIGLTISIMLLPISFSMLKEAIEDSDAGGAAIFLAIFGGLVIVFSYIIEVALILLGGICLPFSYMNRYSTKKAVRVISYIYDAGFAFIIIVAVVKIILFICGI